MIEDYVFPGLPQWEGLAVIEIPDIPTGEFYATDSMVFMHPLDLIAVKHRPALERLDYAMDWILNRAISALDAEIRLLKTAPERETNQ